MTRPTAMRTSRPVLLAAALCLIALPACGPPDDAAGGREPNAPPATETLEVASISVVQIDGRGAGTVWTLDRDLDAERPGAGTAFEAAARPGVRDQIGLAAQRSGPRQIPSFRVVVVWDDGERIESAGGPIMLGEELTAVVRATQKAADPVRG